MFTILLSFNHFLFDTEVFLMFSCYKSCLMNILEIAVFQIPVLE